LKTLVIKFLTDTISDTELQQLKDWLKEPENQSYFEDMARVNAQLDLYYNPISLERSSQKLSQSILPSQKTIRKTNRTLLKYAAVFLLFLVVSISVYILRPFPKEMGPDNTSVTLELANGVIKTLDEQSPDKFDIKDGAITIVQKQNELAYSQLTNSSIKPAFHQLKVPYGKQITVKLVDGTIIKMNSGSTLKYPRSFAHLKTRDIYLEGEALFSVTENKNQPFIVHTAQMNIEVFGTRFSVSNYANDASTSVVLTEGSIGVYDPTQKKKDYLRIVPNQQIIVENGVFSIKEGNIYKHIAWAEGTLFFEDDRFGDIIKKLERHYNVRIESKSTELNNTRYTGSFAAESLPEVLSIFKKITPFKYQIDGTNVKVKPSF